MKTARTVSIVAAVLLTALLAAGSAGVDPLKAQTPVREEAGVSAATSSLLQYQGRLTDPGSGQAVSDGSYSMTFRLYTLAGGGTALWTETKGVAVQGGLFSTLLGDTTPLSQSLFNGQQLWLGIKVEGDDEATPRQRIVPVSYALGLVPGAAVQADSSSPTLQLTNLGSGDALLVNGQTTLTGNLEVSGTLTGGSHSHSGADITSGTVAEPRIASTVARDSEILPAVLGNDGSGSGLDADLLDGLEASAFLTGTHTHSGDDITTGTVAEPRIAPTIARDTEVTSAITAHAGNASAHHPRYTDDEAWGAVLANDGAGSTLNADLLDGLEASEFLTGTHTHSGDDIASGTVAAAYIDSALARDAEVVTAISIHAGNASAHHPRYTDDEAWGAVLARDEEPGSTLNADLLDGQDASAFAATGHDHDGSQITSGTVAAAYIDSALARDVEVVNAINFHADNAAAHHPRYTDDEAWNTVLVNGGPDSGLHADLLDGYHAWSFAFDGHDHDGSQITSGVVAEPHIDGAIARDLEVEDQILIHQGNPSAHHPRYTDDEAWGAVLARDGSGTTLNADLLDGQHAAAFAGAAHGHDHGTLTGLGDDDHSQYFHLSQSETVNGIPAFNGGTSGSSPPFSVDSTTTVANLNTDLLDGYHSSAFAGASHDHLGQSWVGSFGGYGLSIQNTNTSGDGIRGYSSSSSQLDGGLYGVSYSSGSGVVGSSSSGSGVYGTGGTGVYGSSSASSGQGVHGYGSGALTEGVLGSSAQATGVYGIADSSTGSNAIGVWGQTANTWGLFTYNQLYVGGGCVGCTTAYIAQSEDSQPLEVGDVVLISGVAAPLTGAETPVLTVRRPKSGEDGLLGVVQTRAVVEATQALGPSGDHAEGEEIEIANGASGPVARDDYLFVVLQGLVQVRVDASTEAIEVGDPIGPSSTSGAARKLDLAAPAAPVVGRALEPLPEGTGLVWVLILGR